MRFLCHPLPFAFALALCPLLSAQEFRGTPRPSAARVRRRLDHRRRAREDAGWQERGSRGSAPCAPGPIRRASRSRGTIPRSIHQARRQAPDTDGLIGGAGRDHVSRSCAWPFIRRAGPGERSLRPFIDFFLRWPANCPGAAGPTRWDSSRTVARHTAGSEQLHRYHWRITSTGGGAPGADTTVRIRQEIKDESRWCGVSRAARSPGDVTSG
jgi:hypothetical protein